MRCDSGRIGRGERRSVYSTVQDPTYLLLLDEVGVLLVEGPEGVVKGVGLGVAAIGYGGALAIWGLLHRQAAPRLELKLPGVQRSDSHVYRDR